MINVLPHASRRPRSWLISDVRQSKSMNLATTLIIGGCVHAFIGAGVFFAKEEPHKAKIFFATTIKGLLVALLIGFSLKTASGVWAGTGYGLLYGFAFGLVVFLAKGASFKSTPHVLIGSVVQGVVTGALVAALAMK